jgi:hypothetical protein
MGLKERILRNKVLQNLKPSAHIIVFSRGFLKGVSSKIPFSKGKKQKPSAY